MGNHSEKKLHFRVESSQQWAEQIQELLLEINDAVNAAGEKLNSAEAEAFRERYRQILEEAETECPPPDESERKKGDRKSVV